MDEVFGRRNFIGNAVWEKSDSPRMDAIFMSSRHDNTLAFAKDVSKTTWNRVSAKGDVPKHYNKKDKDGRPLLPKAALGQWADKATVEKRDLHSITR